MMLTVHISLALLWITFVLGLDNLPRVETRCDDCAGGWVTQDVLAVQNSKLQPKVFIIGMVCAFRIEIDANTYS